MKSIFVDTSALIAIGNKNDTLHLRSVALQKELLQSGHQFLTANAVLLELFNAFSMSHSKSIALQLFNLITNFQQWKCISIDELIVQGIEWFQNRLDKDWSLVDCIGMLVAEKNEITEEFTTDHHFEQAGFTMLHYTNW